MSDSRYLRRLSESIAGLQGQVRDLSRGIGLGRSSFNGGGITSYSPDGTSIQARYGEQHDGTNGAAAFNGPRPPTPEWSEEFGDPLTAVVGGVLARWEGAFEGGAVALLNHSHVEVHASTDPNFTGLFFGTLRGTITSARGGELPVWLPPLEAGGYYFRLVARTTTGQASLPSAVIGPVNSLKVREEDLGFALDALGGNTITPSTTEPSGDHKLGDLWLQLPDNITHRWTPDGWVESRDAGISEAILTAEAAQEAAALGAQLFVQPAKPTGLTAADKAIWVDSDDDNVSYTWDGTDFVRRQISNSSIKPNSLIAKDVVATGTVSAALLEAILVLATIIIAGDPTGEHTRIDNTGVAVFIDDPVDGIPNEVARLGRQTGGVDPETGRQSWVITEQGRASLRGLSVSEDPIFNGRPLSAMLSAGSRGLVAFGKVDYPQTPGIGVGELGIMEVSFVPEAGRAYAVFCDNLNVAGTVAQDDVWMNVRYATGATKPQVTSSTLVGPVMDAIPAANRYRTYGFSSFLMGVPGNAGVQPVHRLLWTVARGAGGSGTCTVVACQPTVMVWDIGPNVVGTGVINTGGASTTPPAAVQRLDEWHDALWSATYNGSGAYDSGSEMIQGYTSYYPARGNARSLVGWPDMTSRLAGVPDASIEKIELSLYANHWNNNNGGTGVFGFHGNASQPGSFNGTPNQFSWANWGRNQRITIDVTGLAGVKNGFRSGSIRGFTVGPGPSTDPIYYGRFNGAGMAEPPRLHIVYYK